MIVRVVPYDERWPAQSETEAKCIRAALGDVALSIHHIGSTAVPGLSAKPVVDILVEVSSLAGVDVRSSAMESLGYEAKGEYGIPGRRYFRRNDEFGVRTHHVHAFVAGSADAKRHLAFRDYLRSHLEVAQAYGELKQQLAARFPHDMRAYMEGKDSFVKQYEKEAMTSCH